MTFNTRKHALGSLILAATLGFSAQASAMSLMNPQSTDSEQAEKIAPSALPAEQNGTVVLMILRNGINDKVERENRRVPASDADSIMAELLADPDVIAVEKAGTVTTPPVNQPGDSSGVSSQSAMDSFAQSQARGPLRYNDPLYPDQEWFDPTQEHNLRLEPALDRTPFDRTLRIGVIDGGFASSVDLQYFEGVNLRDVNGNPRGALYLNENIDCSYFADGEGNPFPPSLHGHYVSHLIAADANNSLGVAGTTRNVEVAAARSMSCGGSGLDSDIVDGIYWLSGEPVVGVSPISEPVEVINMSLRGTGVCPLAYQTAIDVANSKDIIVVVGAGNDGDDVAKYYPANCENVVTVAAHDTQGVLSSFTNTGANVDIVAQGSAVTTITPDGNKTFISGTSFSTPIVAGVIANVLSERPNLNTPQIEAMIAESGSPIVESPFRTNLGSGFGILDAMRMLDAAGIPREIVAAESALGGERERFAEALSHPLATLVLQDEINGDACSLVEFNANVMPNADANDPFTVFSVPAGAPLDPTAANATVLRQGASDRFIVSLSELTGSNRDYGLARCDIATGSNCNQTNTIRGADVDNLSRPAVCERTVAAR